MKRIIFPGAIVWVLLANPSARACEQDAEYSRMFPAVAEFGRDPFDPINKEAISERIRHICHYLSEHPQVSLKVNGYTGPRGSAASNLARGQRYATWVMKRLILQGCDARRIALHSYGDAGEPQDKSASGAPQISPNRAEIIPYVTRRSHLMRRENMT